MIKEACVETLEQCLNAEKKGASRLELCADLANDGLTPKQDLIRKVFEQVSIPIRVIIRPRAGDFDYSDMEIEKMKSSIAFCKSAGIEGVVFGVCKPDQTLNIEVIKELSDYSIPLKVTIHKAIDACVSPLEELKKLIELRQIDAVLTSGKSETAIEGMGLLKSMIQEAGNKLEIIACGKVTDENLLKLDNELHAKAYHGKLIVGQL